MEDLERRISKLEKDKAALNSFENLAKRVMNISTVEVTRPKMSDINNQLINATKSIESVVFIETRADESKSTLTVEEEALRDMFGRDFGRDFFMPFRPLAGTGSGVIYEENIVLTNYHVVSAVVEHNFEVMIYFNNDGKNGEKGTLIAYDSKLDLALIKVDTSKCKPIKKGNSDNLEQGEIVLVLGAPIGSRSTVSMGVFGGKKMIPWGSELDQRLNEVLQTDADMLAGNSGGPLININGELLGINTYVRADEQTNGTLGYAIPITKAEPFIKQLQRNNKVVRIMIGISFDQTTRSVSGVSVDGGSFNILEVGDIILKVNGEQIKPMTNDIMLNLKRGENKLTISRGKEEKTVIVIGEEYLWNSKEKTMTKLESKL